MKTSLDVIEQAYRRLGIKAEDEALTADQRAYAETTLEALVAELGEHAPVGFWPDAIPENLFVPLSRLLAAEIGPSFEIATEPRGGPYMRVLAVIRPDDREHQSDGPVYY